MLTPTYHMKQYFDGFIKGGFQEKKISISNLESCLQDKNNSNLYQVFKFERMKGFAKGSFNNI